MRLFIAIDVPDVVKEHLSYLQRSLEVEGLRLVHPKNIHLTLNFLGHREDIPVIIEKLSTVEFSPFSLHLSATGFFPSTVEPRVLWVGLEESDELIALQRQIDLLFEPKRSFKAHLTIARMKQVDEKKDFEIVSAVQKLSVKSLSFKVSSFRLYKSTLTPLGAVYEVLETFKGNS